VVQAPQQHHDPMETITPHLAQAVLQDVERHARTRADRSDRFVPRRRRRLALRLALVRARPAV
jgi:hypothetical protein